MTSQLIEFDIRTLRARLFPDVLAMIALSYEKNHSALANKEDLPLQIFSKNPSTEIAQRVVDSATSGQKGESLRFLGFELIQETLKTAQDKLDSMQGSTASVRMDGQRLREMADRWKRNQDRLAERDFRVYCGVLSRMEEGQRFASIRREDIRLGAVGFSSKQDYESFGQGHSLLTDMQIRVTLDELQSRGLFTSVVYGKRHRYFSTALTQAELAEEVLRFHTERKNRKAINLPSIRGQKQN